jgi:hypothetical protein
VIASVVSSSQVTLSWSPSTDNIGVVGYHIVRDGVTLGASTTPSFTDGGVQPATPHSYFVEAFDDAENTSPPSSTVAVATPGAGTRILTFTPIDDTYVEAETPSTSYGAKTEVIADNSPIKHLLVKFDVAGVGGASVTSAKLRLYCVDPSSFGGDFHALADSNWTETTLNWNNEPAAEAVSLGALGAVASGTWYALDVGSLVHSDGTYSINATSTSYDGAHYSSKEGSAAPQLVVTVDDANTT